MARKDTREVDTVKVSIGLLHHLLATAPYGVLRGMGNTHVSECRCSSCRQSNKKVRTLRTKVAS